jgi:hypothetical protein
MVVTLSLSKGLFSTPARCFDPTGRVSRERHSMCVTHYSGEFPPPNISIRPYADAKVKA